MRGRSTCRKFASYLLVTVIVGQLTMIPTRTTAADADPLQDFCIGNLTSDVHINGVLCKDPSKVTNEDFVYHGLEKAGNTSAARLGAVATTAFSTQFPGINSQGISMARIDFAKNDGLNGPHWHPRATEILFVVEGSLLVGFVDTNNKLWSSVLKKGGVTFFPRGLLHFQLNVGTKPALAIVAFNSQNPGRVDVAPSSFGSNITDSILERTFNLSEEAVNKLKAFFTIHPNLELGTNEYGQYKSKTQRYVLRGEL